MTDAAQGPVVSGHNDSSDPTIDVDRWCAVAAAALIDEGVATGTLDLLFVDPEAIAALNQEHLGHVGPTDVLSFPLDGPDSTTDPLDAGDGPPLHLGDVVVCPQVARAQAPDHAGSVEAELTLLVVHGVLHVLGHDHAEAAETAVMQERERIHLARHGHEHPGPQPELRP